jgi:multiple antibiotic resistance protein
MSDDLTFAVLALSAVFFVVDPIVAVPIFLTLTADDSVEKRRSQAARSAMTTFATLTFFAIAGGVLFRLLGITLASFKVAGGLILLLMSIDMMRARRSPTRSTAAEEAEGSTQDDVAVVPLAVPMMAGPGAIATVMVLMSRAAWQPVRTAAVFAAIAITSLAAWVLFRTAAEGERFLRTTTLKILERVMGLLLAAVAVEFMASGIRDMCPALSKAGDASAAVAPSGK